MNTASISVGSRVRHPQYGEGIVLDNSMESAYIIVFRNVGEKAIDKGFEGLEITEPAPLPEQRLSLADVERMMVSVLRKWAGAPENAPIGQKWKGGTLLLQPADKSLKPKEVPVDVFFQKIIMIRDRLRVLEQNINSHKSLSAEEKINLQQYITRCYGSLTTFNVLFRDADDWFKGEGKE